MVIIPHDHRLSVNYRRVRNWYVAELRAAECLYYLRVGGYLSSRCSLQNPHNWWKLAKRACGLGTDGVIPPLPSGGKLFVSSADKAACLNAVFAAQCSAPSSSCQPQIVSLDCSQFSFNPPDVTSVFKKLSSLNARKASGADNVSNFLLKDCATGLAKPLCHISNLSLSSGIFPSGWKKAVIQPVYKHKGERGCPQNYRPIALLPSVSKVCEQFVREQLLTHAAVANALPDEQFGFLPGRSTVWQLLQVLDDWERALDNGESIHACFLDIAKAFDRVDHRLLLIKLRSIGVSGPWPGLKVIC